MQQDFRAAELNCCKKEDSAPSQISQYFAGNASSCPRSDVERVDVNTFPLSDNGEVAVEKQRSGRQNSSLVSYDSKDGFPEGGLRAWAVVAGAFCGCFSVFGLTNSSAILMEYLSDHQLKDNTLSQIGWMIGLALFLTFFCGAPVGPIFDAYGPRAPMLAGSFLLIASMFLLGVCTKYWHFMIVYGVLNGIGGCLVNTPCIASIGHFFLVKRGNATGLAMTAGSLGGIVIPLLLQKLFPAVGFAWATRILGFILTFLLIIANSLVRSRLPRKPMCSFMSVSPDLGLFKDLPFTFVTMGIFLMEWAMFVPLTYITSFATSHGHSSAFGFQIVAVLNAGSVFGRFFAGLVADILGRVNTLILTLIICIITLFALWLPAGESTAMIIVFAVIFGIASGSNLSLSPVCVGQMCKTEQYGRYYATSWMIVAFAVLTSLPIAGQILATGGGDYTGVIVFSGISYGTATGCLVAARVMKVGRRIKVVY